MTWDAYFTTLWRVVLVALYVWIILMLLNASVQGELIDKFWKGVKVVKRWTWYVVVLPLFIAFVVLPYVFYLWLFKRSPSEYPHRMYNFCNWWFK